MKKNILLLSLILVISCSKNKYQNDNLDLSNLDFSGLNFGLNKKEIMVNIDLANQKQINEFSDELINEIDGMIFGKKQVYYRLTMILDKKNKRLKIINIAKIKTQGPLYAKFAGEPLEDLMGSCLDGWTDEGNCSSADCVKKKVSAVLSKIKDNGVCQRVEVSRGWISAKVCSQSC